MNEKPMQEWKTEIQNLRIALKLAVEIIRECNVPVPDAAQDIFLNALYPIQVIKSPD